VSKESIQALRDVVGFAGADWCGVQDTIDPEKSLLLFNSRETNSTLAVSFNPIYFATGDLLIAVKKRLEEHNSDFANRKVSVKASTLKRLCIVVGDVANELQSILEEKHGKTGQEVKRNL